MALTPDELRAFRQASSASRPLVFYDDDADGLSAYLLVRRFNSDAIGVRAARGPELDASFARKVEENIPDTVIILDKPKVSEEFLRELRVPVVWLDHHGEQEVRQRNVTYLNPLRHNARDSRPTSYWVWRALGGPLWLAAAGTTSDWHKDLIEGCAIEHPGLVAADATIEEALFSSRLGELIRIMNFLLKGKSGDIRKRISALIRIDSPEEILDRTTERGKWLYKQQLPLQEEYRKQLAEAMRSTGDEKLFCHVFSGHSTSFVADISNEIMVRVDSAAVIVGRRSSGEVKFSLRSYRKDARRLLENALPEVNGYGGGHRSACGGAVREEDWERFLEAMRTH